MCCRGQLVMLLAPVKVHTHTDADKGTQPAPTRKWREGVGGTCIVMPWSLPNGIVSLSGKAAKGSERQWQVKAKAAKGSGSRRQSQRYHAAAQGQAAKGSGRGSGSDRKHCLHCPRKGSEKKW